MISRLSTDYSANGTLPDFGTAISSLSRTDTIRSQSTWAAPSPLAESSTTQNFSPADLWTSSSYSTQAQNRRGSAWTPSEAPLDDASQFHLFVEATSGLGGFDPNSGGANNGNGPRTSHSVFSPVAQRSTVRTYGPGTGSARDNGRGVQPAPSSYGAPRGAYLEHLQHSSPTSAQRPASVPAEVLHEYYAPIPRPQFGARPQLSRPSPRYTSGGSGNDRRYAHPSRPSQEALAMNRSFAEAMTGFGADLEPGTEYDEELPNYAQSQREMHQRQRRAAAMRAQELELRWALARAHRNGRRQ